MGKYLARSTNKSRLTNGTYDVLKFVALVVLPALNSFWLGLAPVWNLPYVVQIATTIALLDVFLGAVLKLSNDKYKNQQDTQSTPEHRAEPTI